MLLESEKKIDQKRPAINLIMTSYHNNTQMGSLHQVGGAYLVLVNGTEKQKVYVSRILDIKNKTWWFYDLRSYVFQNH